MTVVPSVWRRWGVLHHWYIYYIIVFLARTHALERRRRESKYVFIINSLEARDDFWRRHCCGGFGADYGPSPLEWRIFGNSRKHLIWKGSGHFGGGG
jgi:hypothetical protein